MNQIFDYAKKALQVVWDRVRFIQKIRLKCPRALINSVHFWLPLAGKTAFRTPENFSTTCPSYAKNISAISVLFLCFRYGITIPACRHHLVFSSILNDPCPSTVFHKIPKSYCLLSLELNKHLPSFLFFPFVVAVVVVAGCILPIFFMGEMRRFPFIYYYIYTTIYIIYTKFLFFDKSLIQLIGNVNVAFIKSETCRSGSLHNPSNLLPDVFPSVSLSLFISV